MRAGTRAAGVALLATTGGAPPAVVAETPGTRPGQVRPLRLPARTPLIGAPPVLPLTVLVRADGSIAQVLVEPMYSEQQVLDAVAEHLGIVV